MGALPPASAGEASQLDVQNAAPTPATRKDKRAHKGRRQMEDSFMIHMYKVKMCTRSTPHNWKLCPWAHPGEAAARRHPSCHQADLCHAVRMNRGCPHGESCAWSRNIFEAHLHPDRYRTVMCAMGESCGRNICFFAHNERELRTPPSKAPPSSLLGGELPLAADPAADALQQLALAPHTSAAGSSSNSAGSNVLASSSSNSSFASSNIVSSPRVGQVATGYWRVSPGSPTTPLSSSALSATFFTSPAGPTNVAAAGNAGVMPAADIMQARGLAASHMQAAPIPVPCSTGMEQLRLSAGRRVVGEPCSDLLSLQQQMAGRAAAAAAATAGYATSPTREAALAAAMPGYAVDSLTGLDAATAAAAGLAGTLASSSTAVVGTPPSVHSPLMAATAGSSPYMTPPPNRQHLMQMAEHSLMQMNSPGGTLLGYPSPQYQYTMQQQQQQQSAAMQQVYQSQVQATAATNAAAAAAAAAPGLLSPGAGIIHQKQQLEANTAALAAELLAFQTATAMQAAATQQQQQQQQELINSMLLQDLSLGGTGAVASAVGAAGQCMSPQQRAAAWGADAAAAAAAGRQQQALHEMLLLAEAPQGSPGGIWG